MEAGRSRHVDDGVELGEVGIPVQVDDGGEGLEGGRLHPGLEKTRFLLKNTQPSGFFGVFLGFIGCLGFLFFYIFIQKRVFKGFFSFKNTYRCIQALNYNHSY